MTSVVVSRPSVVATQAGSQVRSVVRRQDVVAVVDAAVQQTRFGRLRRLSSWPGCDPTGGVGCAGPVQAAIDAFTADGDLVLVDGVFLLDARVDLPTGSYLIGGELVQGWLLAADGQSMLRASGVSDVTLDGVTLTGAHDGTPWGTNETSGTPAQLVRITGSSRVTIRDCTLRRSAGPSIHILDSQVVTVDGCVIIGSGRGGIICWQTSGALEDITITGNQLRGCGDDGIAVWADTNTIPNGTVESVSTTAGSTTITGVGTSWTTAMIGQQIAIAGAGPSQQTWEGRIVAVSSATTATVDHAPARTVTAASALRGHRRPRQIVIAANLVDLTIEPFTGLETGRPIAVGGVSACTITGNVVQGGCQAGIHILAGIHDTAGSLLWSQHVNGAGNVVRRAGTASNPSQSPRCGVAIQGARNCSIDAVVSDPLTQGVLIEQATHVTVRGSVTAAGSEGVRINSGSEITLDGMTIQRCGDVGVRWSAATTPSPSLTLRGCTIVDNVGTGVTVSTGQGILRLIGCRVGDTRSSGRTQTASLRTTSTQNTIVSTGCDFRSTNILSVLAGDTVWLTDGSDLTGNAIPWTALEPRALASRTITAGPGLQGGGDLTANRSLSLADAPAGTLKGRAVGAGTGTPTDLTPAQARTLLNVADGATANASDAELRDRSTHTGTQPASSIANWAAEVWAAAQPINTQTGSYVCVAADAGRLITVNASSPATVTIPPNSSVPYPVGTRIDIAQLGTGQITVTSTDTIRATPTAKLRAQWSAATAVKIAADEWLLVGDLASS